MNAYELADYLDNNVEAMLMSEQAYIDNASIMLRKQEDRLEVLEANYKLQKNINEKALTYIEELEREVFALHNTLKNRMLRTYDGKLND